MAIPTTKRVFPSSSSNPESIMFIEHNERCHAEVVNQLSVEPSWRNYMGRYNVGTDKKPLEFDVYRTSNDINFDPWGFEAIPADSESERSKENRLRKLHEINFYKKDVLSGVSDEELFAELQRRGYKV